MKRILITLLCILFYFQSSAQLFGGESVTIYGVTFKAKEVTGQNKFNSNENFYRTSILNPLITKRSNDYYNSLGSYRRNKNVMETLGLFNLSIENNSYPFLDSIDFDYYKSNGFIEVEKVMPDLKSDNDYLKLKSCLVDSVYWPIMKRKQFLFAAKDLYRNLIIASRYEIISNDFTIDKKKISKVTAELKAQLDTIKINTTAEVSANIRLYFSRLADESTVITGVYLDARLHPNYIDKINYYVRSTPKIKIGNDQFAFNLKNYITSENAAANTSIAAIQLNGYFKKTKISIDSVAVDLQTKFQIPANEAIKIAASVNFTFSRNETTTFTNKFNNVFIIRYFTSSIIDDIQFPEQKFTN